MSIKHEINGRLSFYRQNAQVSGGTIFLDCVYNHEDHGANKEKHNWFLLNLGELRVFRVLRGKKKHAAKLSL